MLEYFHDPLYNITFLVYAGIIGICGELITSIVGLNQPVPERHSNLNQTNSITDSSTKFKSKKQPKKGNVRGEKGARVDTRMIGCSLNELKQLIQKKERPDQKAKHQTKTNKPPKEERASKRGEGIKAKLYHFDSSSNYTKSCITYVSNSNRKI
ncbi:hypothetical protein WN51_02646 [Melipona quadrifasciata]|uniref:Uncharacterized protein n=1 Tax=Melipona quadrifasciata TaxID=166423 RepID=A0A0M8ZT45_9HYME|nr:hypothetical protein WN51_02646 [Melipona quadrifasciata]